MCVVKHLRIILSVASLATLCACGGASSSATQEASGGGSSGSGSDLTSSFETIDAATASDGVWTLTQAKQAFALLVTSLPDVTAPSGADEDASAAAGHNVGELGASLALRTMVAHWDELTAAEQQIVGTEAGATAVDATLNVPLKSVATEKLSAAELRAQVLSVFNDQVTALETKLGFALGLTIDLKIAAFGNPKARASALPMTAAEAALATFLPEANPGAPAVCRVKVAPTAATGDAASLRHTLAHEAFHCFQAKMQGLALHRDKTKFVPWVAESSANWAADQVVGVTDLGTGYWKKWFQTPNVSIQNRTYTAHGLFAEVDYLGNSVWPLMPTLLDETSGSAALNDLIAPVETTLERSWAASLTRQPARSTEWNITGTGVPDLAVTPQTPALADTDIKPVSVSQWAADVFRLSAPAELVMLNIAGDVRIGDGAAFDSATPDISYATLCTVSTCTCPDGSALPFPVKQVTLPVDIAVTGWSTGATGDMEGFSLSRFCTGTTYGAGDKSKRFCEVVAPIVTIASTILANENGHPTEFQAAWTAHVKIVKAANAVAPAAIAAQWARIVELYDTYTTPLYTAIAWDPQGVLIFDAAHPERFVNGQALWNAYSPILLTYLADLQTSSAYLQSACGLTWSP